MNYADRECDLQRGCRIFNLRISSARTVVERAYGQMKRRFSKLGGRSSEDDVVKVGLMVRAACVLHNLNIDTEATKFGVHRHERPLAVFQPLREVVEIQKRSSVPAPGRYIGNDAGVREGGRAVRRAVANDTLSRQNVKSRVTL